MTGKKTHLKIGWLCLIVCIVPLLISSISTITTLLLRSKESCEESVYRQMDLILDDRITAIQNYIDGAETYMRQYGTAPVIKEMLLALNKGEQAKFRELQKKAQSILLRICRAPSIFGRWLLFCCAIQN